MVFQVMTAKQRSAIVIAICETTVERARRFVRSRLTPTSAVLATVNFLDDDVQRFHARADAILLAAAGAAPNGLDVISPPALIRRLNQIVAANEIEPLDFLEVIGDYDQVMQAAMMAVFVAVAAARSGKPLVLSVSREAVA